MGAVPTEATKFKFSDGASRTAVTYIKTGENGISVSSSICFSVESFFYLFSLHNLDPKCGDLETCTEPEFVIADKNRIDSQVFNLPFLSQVSSSLLYTPKVCKNITY